LNSKDVELLVAEYFNPRVNIVVPNVYWGMGFNHECDVFVLTPNNYGYEIEIKVNKYDLINDKNKPHRHGSQKIKRLYFAITEELEPYCDHIPEEAGILSIRKNKYGNKFFITKVREAKCKCDYKFTQEEKVKLLHLATMRIFPLKKILSHEIKQNPTHVTIDHVKSFICNCYEYTEVEEIERYILAARNRLSFINKKDINLLDIIPPPADHSPYKKLKDKRY
jgi:hypothetical protein